MGTTNKYKFDSFDAIFSCRFSLRTCNSVSQYNHVRGFKLSNAYLSWSSVEFNGRDNAIAPDEGLSHIEDGFSGEYSSF